ncbi:MAG: energy transducer TonB [Pelagibacterales bacterium]|nr:energy transducer TonB [Pelagibacterales bacterium]
MNKIVKNDKKSHYIALFLAVFLHILITFWLLFKKSEPLVLQQAIRVEMVSPSSQKKVKKEIQSDKKENFITSKNNQTKNLETKNHKNKPKKLEEENSKNASEVNTSGKVDKNATAKNSAISDPIFNASYLYNPIPPYPSYARAKGFEGRVILEVLVSKNGTAKIVTISKSSGYDTLDSAAKDSVEKWRFVPAQKGLETIEAKVFVPIEFKLNN